MADQRQSTPGSASVADSAGTEDQAAMALEADEELLLDLIAAFNFERIGAPALLRGLAEAAAGHPDALDRALGRLGAESKDDLAAELAEVDIAAAPYSDGLGLLLGLLVGDPTSLEIQACLRRLLARPDALHILRAHSLTLAQGLDRSQSVDLRRFVASLLLRVANQGSQLAEEISAPQDNPRGSFAWILAEPQLFQAVLAAAGDRDLELGADAGRLLVLGARRNLDWLAQLFGQECLEQLLPAADWGLRFGGSADEPLQLPPTRLRLLEVLVEAASPDPQHSPIPVSLRSPAASGAHNISSPIQADADPESAILVLRPAIRVGLRRLQDALVQQLRAQTRADVLVGLNLLELWVKLATGGSRDSMRRALQVLPALLWELLRDLLPSSVLTRGGGNGLEAFMLPVWLRGCLGALARLGALPGLQAEERAVLYHFAEVCGKRVGHSSAEDKDNKGVKGDEGDQGDGQVSAAMSDDDAGHSGDGESATSHRGWLWPRNRADPGYEWAVLLRALLGAAALAARGYPETPARGAAVACAVGSGTAGLLGDGGDERDNGGRGLSAEDSLRLARQVHEILALCEPLGDTVTGDALLAVGGLLSSVSGLLWLLDPISGQLRSLLLSSQPNNNNPGAGSALFDEASLTMIRSWFAQTASLDTLRLLAWPSHAQLPQPAAIPLIEACLQAIAKFLVAQPAPPSQASQNNANHDVSDAPAFVASQRAWRLFACLQALVLEQLGTPAETFGVRLPAWLKPSLNSHVPSEVQKSLQRVLEAGYERPKISEEDASAWTDLLGLGHVAAGSDAPSMSLFEHHPLVVAATPSSASPSSSSAESSASRASSVSNEASSSSSSASNTSNGSNGDTPLTRALRAMDWVVQRCLQLPFVELRLAGVHLLASAALHSWGTGLILGTAGLPEVLAGRVLAPGGADGTPEAEAVLARLRLRLLERLCADPQGVLRNQQLRVREDTARLAETLGCWSLAPPLHAGNGHSGDSGARGDGASDGGDGVAKEWRVRAILVQPRLKLRLEEALAEAQKVQAGRGWALGGGGAAGTMLGREAQVMDPVTRTG